MANFTKLTKAQKAVVMRHIQRENREYSNKQIDPERTHLNYSIIDRENALQYTNERIEQSKHLTRDNIVQLVAFTVTIPKDYNGDDRTFFVNTTNFIIKDFGRDNIAYAEVHLDETNPHLHIGIIPITQDNRLCAKDLIDKPYLTHFHDRLQDYIREKDPQHTINIQRDKEEREHKTKNLEMREYKIQQKEKELNERENKINERNKIIDKEEKYHSLIDLYCEREGMTIHQYNHDVFMYDKGYSQEPPIPEAINPERDEQERQEIINHYKEEHEEQEHQKDHDRDR